MEGRYPLNLQYPSFITMVAKINSARRIARFCGPTGTGRVRPCIELPKSLRCRIVEQGHKLIEASIGHFCLAGQICHFPPLRGLLKA